MNVPDTIHRRADQCHTHRDAYSSGQYNETQVRREFIDPMWKALAWDIDNTRRYAELYKDVVHEGAIKIGGVTKAPDYCFRIGGVSRQTTGTTCDDCRSWRLRCYAPVSCAH